MGVQPIALPNFPPEGPWDAYVSIIIWIPLILRIVLLMVPFRNAIRKLAPHAGWALKQVRDLPVRGFGLLAANETLAILFPPLAVLMVRMLFDPIGWQEWDEVSNLGGTVLLLLLFFWIFFDIFPAPVRATSMAAPTATLDIKPAGVSFLALIALLPQISRLVFSALLPVSFTIAVLSFSTSEF